MKGFNRNIKYWMFYLGKSALIIWGLMLVISTFTAVLDGELMMAAVITRYARYILVGTLAFLFANAFANITVVFPITVSMGSRRSSSIAAMEVVQHIVTFVSFAVAIGLMCISAYDIVEMMLPVWPFLLGLFFMVMGLGTLVSILCDKLGRLFGTIVYAVIIATGTFLIVIYAERAQEMLSKLDFLSPTMMLMAVVIGLVFDSVMIVLLIISTRKTELKFA